MRSILTRQLTTVGEDFDNAAAGTTADILVYLRDHADNILLASGLDVPVDTTSGYAKGCVFIDRNVVTGTNGRYENVGTATSCNFDIAGTISADSVDSENIVDDAVSLEHLDSGITSGFIIPAAGEETWTGSGATLAASVSGALATDIALGSIHTLGTQGTILQGAVASSGAVTFTLDAANTSNDAVISYMTLRAIS